MLNLEFLRRLRGIPQGKLGRSIGYSRELICGVERGWIRPSEKFKSACSKYFDLPAEELFKEIEEPI